MIHISGDFIELSKRKSCARELGNTSFSFKCPPSSSNRYNTHDRCCIFHSFSSQSNSFINSSISFRSRIIDNNLHADTVSCNSQNL